MSVKLTPKLVVEHAVPTDGRDYDILWDTERKGVGHQVTKAGARSYVFGYTTKSGIARRLTIGSDKDWSLAEARKHCKGLRQEVDNGGDPMGARHKMRTDPTVADPIQRWRDEKASKKRPTSLVDDEGMIRKWIMPAFGKKKVADVEHEDIVRLHHKISTTGGRKGKGATIRANRVAAYLSRLFALSVTWKMRSDNPVKGVERNPETSRERYLDGEELERFLVALAAHPNRRVANVIELLLLTGARRSEVMKMRWDQLDLTAATWRKEASATKQAKSHFVPLNPPAQEILIALKAAAEKTAEPTITRRRPREMSPWVFPARYGGGPLTDVKHVWHALCQKAGINDLKLHDLRHSYASHLASGGLSLLVIGRLLGHSRPQTTARYSHLALDPMRAATNQVGAFVTAAKTGASGEIVPMTERKRSP